MSPAQPRSPDGAVTLQAERFRVELARLAPGVERLAFAVVPENGDLRGVGRGEVSIGLPNGPAAASWTFAGTDFGNERAIIAFELYRHQGAWRLMVNGQGFADGLGGLVRHFGGSGVPDLRPAAPPAPSPATPAPPPSFAPPPAASTSRGPGATDTPAPPANPTQP